MINDDDKYQTVVYKKNKDNTYKVYTKDLTWTLEAPYESLNKALCTFDEWYLTSKETPRKLFKVGILLNGECLYTQEQCQEIVKWLLNDRWCVQEEDIEEIDGVSKL